MGDRGRAVGTRVAQSLARHDLAQRMRANEQPPRHECRRVEDKRAKSCFDRAGLCVFNASGVRVMRQRRKSGCDQWQRDP
eukprot:362070-Chlamydomonas_euryale.AAC.13